MFLEISQNSQQNTSARVSFLIKLQAWACNFIKSETLTQVISFKFCEISKNTFSYRTPPLVNFFLEDFPDDSRPDMFYKKRFSEKIFQNSQENFLSGVHSFCVRLKVYSLDFNEECLHWYLKNFFKNTSLDHMQTIIY